MNPQYTTKEPDQDQTTATGENKCLLQLQVENGKITRADMCFSGFRRLP